MNPLCKMGADEISQMVRDREVSPVEVVDAYYEQIHEANPTLNAIVTLNAHAKLEAEHLADSIVRGDVDGKLLGVPFTVKDAYDTAHIRTTRGSTIFAKNIGRRDSTAVARFKAAGGILIGKTNIPEFCLGVETDNMVFGRTVNPWDHSRTPGGSSGGEASAIAGGMSALGLGSDQGGSVRLPAHYTGIVGFKPTLGRIPITGHYPDTLHGFATAGVMAKYVADVRLALDVASGPDGSDWQAQVPNSPSEARPLNELRIGWIAGEFFGTLDEEPARAVEDAAAGLRAAGAEVVDLPPDFIPSYDCDLLSEGLYRAEGIRWLEPVVAGHEASLHPWLRDEMTRASRDLPAYLEAAAGVEEVRAGFQQYFQTFDILLCPAAPVTAPMCDSSGITVQGVPRRLRSVNRALQPFNLAGLPALVVPFTMSTDGLPIGVQIVGPKYQEADVLGVGSAVELTRPLGQSLVFSLGL